MIRVNGVFNTWAQSFKTKGGIPSNPVAFFFFILRSSFSTNFSDTGVKENMRHVRKGSNEGGVQIQSLKTKALFFMWVTTPPKNDENACTMLFVSEVYDPSILKVDVEAVDLLGYRVF